MALQVARLVAVLALLCVAAAIATPKGRLPLALRGLAKLLNTATGASSATQRGCCGYGVSPAKRLLAFALVVLAVILALI